MELSFCGEKASVLHDERILQMDGDDVCTKVSIYLTLLNCILRNG